MIKYQHNSLKGEYPIAMVFWPGFILLFLLTRIDNYIVILLPMIMLISWWNVAIGACFKHNPRNFWTNTARIATLLWSTLMVLSLI